MKEHYQRIAAIGFLTFLMLWGLGFIRGLFVSEPEVEPLPPISFSLSEYTSSLRTANNLKQIGLLNNPLPQVLEKDVNLIRIFEKTAQLTSASTAFGDDEARLRKAIEAHKAVVFNEKATGLAPQRSLSVGVSVHPDRFDALLAELKRVGSIESIHVQGQDRTTEFRRLHAQRHMLKKHQEAILKLRDNKLEVEATLRLEERIREIEKEIQTVEGQLGDLVGKEPSYNLVMTLQEYRVGSRHDRAITLTRRLANAFLWAVEWWFVTAAALGLLFATYVSVKTVMPRPQPVM